MVRVFLLALISLVVGVGSVRGGSIQWRSADPHFDQPAEALGVFEKSVVAVCSDGKIYTSASPATGAWTAAGSLAQPRRHAALTSDSAALYMIGGLNLDGTASAAVSRIRLAAGIAADIAAESSMTALPSAMAHPAAAIVSGRLIVVDDDGSVLSLDLKNTGATWQSVARLPAPTFRTLAIASQSNGDVTCLYLFGLDEQGAARTFVYSPAINRWTARAAPPFKTVDALAAASLGQVDIALFSASGSSLYHTITDTWSALENTPFSTRATARLGAALVAVAADGKIAVGTVAPMTSRFGVLDYIALAAYPAFLLLMGVIIRVKTSDADGYFRGGQAIPWWAAGLSLLATQVSAIGFMAIPAKSFATDWVYFTAVLLWFAIVPVVTHFYIPMFRRLNVTTAYEYLETRFNFPMRLFAAVAFMLVQVTRAAIVLYLPALAFSAVTGVDKMWCIVGMGVVSTLYTLWGGFETVVWTDVVQALTLLGGVALCMGIAVYNVGGVGAIVSAGLADGKFNLVSDRVDIGGPALWVVLIGGFFARLAALTADQNVVQRYQSTPSVSAASRALWTDALVSIPWAILIFALGTTLYVFYKMNPGLIDPSSDIDQVVPLFIAQRVPSGLAGLIIAAIFAASLDGSMLSVATVFVKDVYVRLTPGASARSQVALARVLTLALGGFATGIGALLAVSNIASLLDQASRFSGLFSGAIAGVFVLGLFCRRVGTAAAFVGVLASAITMYFVETSGRVSILIYACFGISSCVCAALVASAILPRRASVRPDDDNDRLTDDRLVTVAMSAASN